MKPRRKKIPKPSCGQFPIKPRDKTIAEKFSTYKFADYKEKVIDLLGRVCTVSVKTVGIVDHMAEEEPHG
ncbi:MAG: hypothetical protein B6244_05370 [Candidatus Cloacimonetes bacterium 4572_55]|nr:MAG: hypothetical protein B6244_05370 [Candidatus Cloacimonetes bacterium 4572_55]